MDKDKKILVVENLTKIFKVKNFFGLKNREILALDNISFDLNRGEILGFLGPNGSGKTTTIQILLNLMTPTYGKIHYFDKNFFTHLKQTLKQVTFASSYVRLPGSLTIYENLNLFAQLYDLTLNKRKSKIQSLLESFDLWQFRNRPVNKLSSGQAARVMLAKAFLPDPKIVLLDEPTAALDPDIATQVHQFILKQQRENNTSILFTSHNMAEVAQLCSRIIVLKNGKIIANNKPAQLAKTVSLSRVNLLFEHDIHKIENFLKSNSIIYKLQQNNIEIDIDESQIPALLNALALNGFKYINISIDKPTLQDYFLSLKNNQ